MKRRILTALAITIPILLLFPFTVAAATNSEIITLMQSVISGILSAGRDAYCAAGITAFCP